MNEAALFMWIASVITRMKEKDPASGVHFGMRPGEWQCAIAHTPNRFQSTYSSLMPVMLVGACLSEFMESVNKWVEDYKFPEPVEEKDESWAVAAMKDARTQLERKKSAQKMYGTWVDWNNTFNKNPRNYAKGGK